MVSVLTKIAELRDYIDKHIGSLDKDCDQIVEKSDLLMKELLRVGVAWKATLKPGQVRVHPRYHATALGSMLLKYTPCARCLWAKRMAQALARR